MTFEELKVEADKQGYKLIKKTDYVKTLPCPVCQRKRIEHWYGREGQFLKCPQCDFKSSASKTDSGARKAWNEAVVNYLKER